MSAAFILHFDEIQNSSPRHLEFWSNDVFGHTICFLVVYCTFLQKCEKFVHPAAIFFFCKNDGFGRLSTLRYHFASAYQI